MIRKASSTFRPSHSTKECAHCGKGFSGLSFQIYCSPQCSSRAYYLRNPYESTAAFKERFAILARDDFRCRYCGRGPQDNVKLHVDHIFPKIKQGSNDSYNKITACEECNEGKHHRLLLTRKGQIPSFLLF